MFETQLPKFFRKKAIIHDWDETIVRTFGSVAQLIQEFGLEVLGKEVSIEQIRDVWGQRIPDMLSALFGSKGTQSLSQIYAKFVPMGFVVEPFDCCVETLELLRARGYFLGIVSSGREQYIRATLDSFFPDDPPFNSGRFEYSHVTSSDNAAFLKPDPRVFEETLRVLMLLGISPGETLYVGDSLDDFNASRGVFDFVGLTSGFTSREDFREAGLPNNLILDSFQLLPSLLS